MKHISLTEAETAILLDLLQYCIESEAIKSEEENNLVLAIKAKLKK